MPGQGGEVVRGGGGADHGVAVAGVMGTLQAVEVLKELLGLGDSLDGTLLIYEALRVRFHRIRIAKDPDCPTCGGASAT